MWRLADLTKHQNQQVIDALHGPLRDYTVTGALRDLDNNHVLTLPSIDSIRVDMAAVGRAATITILDPKRRLHQAAGRDAHKYLIHATFVPFIDALNDYVPIPVYTGGIDTTLRTGDELTITSRGAGMCAQHSFGRPLDLKKGMKRTDALRAILHRAGFRDPRLVIPDLPHRLPHDLTYKPKEHMWTEAQKMADSVNLALWGDVQGNVVARELGIHPVIIFGSGDGGWLTALSVSSNGLNIVNRVVFHYGPEKAHNAPVIVNLPPGNPLSSTSLAMGGVEQIYQIEVTNVHVRSKTGAHRNALRILDEAQREVVQVQGTLAPFPLLEPGDTVGFHHIDYVGHGRPDSWTWQPDQDMTIGFTAYA